jgi:hypothetical protein
MSFLAFTTTLSKIRGLICVFSDKMAIMNFPDGK